MERSPLVRQAVLVVTLVIIFIVVTVTLRSLIRPDEPGVSPGSRSGAGAPAPWTTSTAAASGFRQNDASLPPGCTPPANLRDGDTFSCAVQGDGVAAANN